MFNKIDLVDPMELTVMRARSPGAVFASATTGEGLEELRRRIGVEASRRSLPMSVLIPFSRGELVKVAHENAEVMSEEPTEAGWRMELRVPPKLIERYSPFERTSDAPEAAESADGDV